MSEPNRRRHLAQAPAFLFAVLGVTAVVLGIMEGAATQSGRAIVGVGGAIILLGYGAFLLWIARGVWRLRQRAHAAALAVALIHLPIAWSFADGNTWWIAVLLAASSVLTLIVLVLPGTMRAFGRIQDLED